MALSYDAARRGNPQTQRAAARGHPAWERIDAERTVLSVNGVKGVVNQLEVKPKPRPE